MANQRIERVSKMIYADYRFYKNKYRKGSEGNLSERDFPFFEQQARTYIDSIVLCRIELNFEYDKLPKELKLCICELAEHIYQYEGSDIKASESVAGNSITYRQGIKYQIVFKYLFPIGLMYRGSRNEQRIIKPNNDNDLLSGEESIQESD
jgi:hypothetical protein